jgi:aspartate-semialdehyde dehydrogenase
MKVAVVGATGMVGTVMLKVLAERKFPVTELIPVASKTSVGKTISWQDKDYRVHSLEEALLKKPDLALFSGVFVSMGSKICRCWHKCGR